MCKDLKARVSKMHLRKTNMETDERIKGLEVTLRKR